jgi:hypothetical protein
LKPGHKSSIIEPGKVLKLLKEKDCEQRKIIEKKVTIPHEYFR